MSNLVMDAARVVAQNENLSVSYILSAYDENTICRLAFMYNREREMAHEAWY